MPAISAPVRVLATGFGPFMNYEENPSWLAVSTLHNTILQPTPTAAPITRDEQQALAPPARPIHITALKMPVTYSAVLTLVPGLHARPPVLPGTHPDADADVPLAPYVPHPRPDVPHDGFDLVLHVGVAGRGPLRVERLAHKVGYMHPDAANELAPVLDGRLATLDQSHGSDEAEKRERDRLQRAGNDGEIAGWPVRGFAEGYERFDDELTTEIDAASLVEYMRSVGVKEVAESSNAGRYLCDFIYYCSLASAQATASVGGKWTKVLFLHCPPVDEPLSTGQVAEAIKLIISHVCSQL